jgi:hypothetical protein
MTSSNTNYLSEAPPPNTHNMNLEIEFPTHELWGILKPEDMSTRKNTCWYREV